MTASSEVPASFRSSSVRPGPLALIRTGITEVASRRRLIRYLVRADLKKAGTDTLLGNIWWVVDPLLQMLVYYIFVGIILARGGPDYPLFIFTAILPWKWFTSTVGDGVASVITKEKLIKQIFFPKMVLPLAAAASGVVSFAFGFIPLFVLMLLLWPNHITAYLVLIPVVAVPQFLFSLAIAIAASAANVFYRDIGNLTRHVLRFWFYLSPALYGLDEVEKLAGKSSLVSAWFKVNPFTYILVAYRDIIYYGRPPEWASLVVVSLVSVVLIGLAVLFFKRAEPSFAKVL